MKYGSHFFRFLIFREKRKILSHYSRKTKKNRKKSYLQMLLKNSNFLTGTKFKNEILFSNQTLFLENYQDIPKLQKLSIFMHKIVEK